MQVILLEKVEKLGSLGDVVTVKNGFARNYLLPRGKALRATDAHLADFEKMKAEAQKKDKERKEAASALCAKIDDLSFIFVTQSGDDGRLYGSINAKDISERIQKDCKESVSPSCIKLQSKIKDRGIYRICIELHPEVNAFININIARSEEEAKVAFDAKVKQDLAAAEKSKKLRETSGNTASESAGNGNIEVKSSENSEIELSKEAAE